MTSSTTAAQELRTQAARVGKAHRVVLPPQVREALGVKEGDSVLFRIQDGEVRLQSMRTFTQEVQTKYAGLLSGAAAELIAERRAEAKRE